MFAEDLPIRSRKLVFIKHAHNYAVNNDEYHLLYINLLVHVQAQLHAETPPECHTVYGPRKL